jgi:hypothetical protein
MLVPVQQVRVLFVDKEELEPSTHWALATSRTKKCSPSKGNVTPFSLLK